MSEQLNYNEITIKKISETFDESIKASPFKNLKLKVNVNEATLRNKMIYLTLYEVNNENGNEIKYSIPATMFTTVFNKSGFTFEQINPSGKAKTETQIEVVGEISYYKQLNKVQFLIWQILSVGGLTPDEIKKEKLLKELESKGYIRPSIFNGVSSYERVNPKPITIYPNNLAVITADGSDGKKDVVKHILEKNPLVNFSFFYAAMQGNNVSKEVVFQIDRINQLGNFDAILLTRGGGSSSDLIPFDDENIAYAIIKSKIPVIVAIGHTNDEHVAEIVADLRKATPTNIATAFANLYDNLSYYQNLVSIIFKNNLKLLIQKCYAKISNQKLIFEKLSPQNKLNEKKYFLNKYKDYLLNLVNNKILFNYNLINQKDIFSNLITNKLHNFNKEISNYKMINYNFIYNKLSKNYNKFNLIKNQIVSNNPNKILNQGYARIKSALNRDISSCKNLKINDEVKLILKDGFAKGKITEIKER